MSDIGLKIPFKEAYKITRFRKQTCKNSFFLGSDYKKNGGLN